MDYLYNVIDYEVMKFKILYTFFDIDKLFTAVCCVNFDSLLCTLGKQNEFKKFLDIDNNWQSGFFKLHLAL